MQSVIRTDADSELGWGHLARSLVLAHELREMGRPPLFILGFSDEAATRAISDLGFPFELAPNISLENESTWLKNRLTEPSLFVFDFSHTKNFSRMNDLVAYLGSLKSLGHKLALIDGLKSDSLALRANLPIDLLVTPYAGSQAQENVPYRQLVGPSYFVAAKEYDRLRVRGRKVSKSATKLLLTFGGSDPLGLTPKAMGALKILRGENLAVRVVVGASFPRELVVQIEKDALALAHQVEIVRAPNCLAEQICWADIAISTTGLTKYELALCGTPALLLSLTESAGLMNNSFATLGTSLHLGVHSNVSAQDIASHVASLAANQESRQKMCEAGLQAVDGLGAQRILNEAIHL